MRVSCESFSDFIEHLDQRTEVFDNTLFISRAARPLDVGKVQVKFAVTFQCSTVILTDQHQYILEVGVDCGLDYHDASNEHKGTAKAKELSQVVKDYAEKRGWRVLPGGVGFSE
jgi:hypothetical protein